MAFRSLYFAQGEEARPMIELLDHHGEGALLDHIGAAGGLDWQGEVRTAPCAGTGDTVLTAGKYLISYNSRLSYIGIEWKEA